MMNILSIDKRQRTLFWALIISLLIHLGIFWVIQQKNWLQINTESLPESVPEEVSFVFPENKPRLKPRQVVENQNANNLVPKKSDLLSEHNSQARNPNPTAKVGLMPQSSGNTRLPNLASPRRFKGLNRYTSKPFSKKALTGESANPPLTLNQQRAALLSKMQSSDGTNEKMEQKEFSALEVGGLTLSTYKWNWAPYINAMKRKLIHVWFPPTAYYPLGLIHGATIIKYTVDRKGKLLGMRVLRHNGHHSLELSSTQAIEALFPFLPLPDDFPEEKLTIIAELVYPDLRNGR